jgi:PPOX class probable F420-dependent enzyme
MDRIKGTLMTAQLQDLLDKAYYAWFTTVRADGMPQPTPVWFIWGKDRASLLMFSIPGQQKLINIANNNRVALSWSSDTGWPYVIVMGTAQVDDMTEDERAAYIAKYGQGIKDLDMSLEKFAETYTAIVRITPERIRGDA